MCILVHFYLKSKNKETNDKQPSQSLIDDSPLRLFPLLKADKLKNNMQAKLHLEKSSQGEMLLAFKLLVYWYYLLQIFATEWLNMIIINQHGDFSSPYMQVNFTNFFIPSFECQAGAWAGTNANKISSHQTTYNWMITGPNNKVWICLYQ